MCLVACLSAANLTPVCGRAGNPPKTPAARAAVTFDSGRAFEHVRQLVAIGPRPAGSPGIETARRYISDQMKAHVERPLRARDRIGDDRFFHMYYHEMMADTMGVMRRIYDWAGDELTSDVEARMQQWLAEHPQDKLGVNTYSLDQYGLTLEQLKPVFADYLDTFDIELEAAT